MKIVLLPDMAARRAEAEGLVDRHFGPEIGRLCQFSDLYRRKVDEARDVIAGKGPGPLICAEADARGDFVDFIAETILAKSAANAEALAEVEQQRLAAKSLVRAAAAPAALETVLSDLGISR
ncbi:hypothetical protein FZC33_11245 [Labrys sp. KNU-23]|uniref:hypothetical protein n=1 Tax=Labrys sp. KNU-23 TaxID=2789216 RepID=UPI0011EC18E0|nr:hypothetical protein [Labrys sp. KNU-23]QEN86866.1 hypothetical protein FZC33_11245 [Labrys sp. KNU-23]